MPVGDMAVTGAGRGPWKSEAQFQGLGTRGANAPISRLAGRCPMTSISEIIAAMQRHKTGTREAQHRRTMGRRLAWGWMEK